MNNDWHLSLKTPEFYLSNKPILACVNREQCDIYGLFTLDKTWAMSGTGMK